MGLQTVEEVKDAYDMELSPAGNYQVVMGEIRRNEPADGNSNADEPPAPPPTISCPMEQGDEIYLSACETCPEKGGAALTRHTTPGKQLIPAL